MHDAAADEANAADETTDAPQPITSEPLTDPLPSAPSAPRALVADAQWWQNQPSLDMPFPLPAEMAAYDANADPADPADSTPKRMEGPAPSDQMPVMSPMTFRVAAVDSVAQEVVAPPPAFTPGFLNPASRRASPRPISPAWLVVAIVVALAALVLQVIFHERDFLAARQPALMPILSSLCRPVGCEMTAPRQIASIAIDGASFSHEPEGDGYRLYFSLRNAAPMALKMPAVELTLLDTQERPVLRRVLLPGDFGAPAVLPPHAERTASLRLLLSGAEVATLSPLAGYHVDPFYP